MKVSELGEFNLIKKLQKKWPGHSRGVIVGIGDDAAVVKVNQGNMLITSDMMIEGVHFDRSFTTFYQLGYKFLAVNISDILAMGGNPGYFLVNLGIPEDFDAGDVSELYSGMKKIARKFGVALIGGDTCTSHHVFILSGTLVGEGGHFVTRSGAKAGDGIFVTAPLGDSAMGLHLLTRRGSKVHRFSPVTARLKLMKKHLMPEPAALKNRAKITSMIDVSDGLLIDLSHICDESRTGAVLYKEKIPLSPELQTVARSMREDPYGFALKGGEDYCLLFTAPRDYRTDAYEIGQIVKTGRYIIDGSGKKTAFGPEGYEHFKDKSKIINKRSKLLKK